MWGPCGAHGTRFLGVRLEVLRDLEERASIDVGEQLDAIDHVSPRRPSKGARHASAAPTIFKTIRRISVSSPRTPAHKVDAETLKSYVSMDLIATRVVRPRMQETRRPFVATLQNDPLWLKASINAMVRSTLALHQPVGRANVLLVTSEDVKVGRVISAVAGLAELPPSPFFYLDELCSVDMRATVKSTTTTARAGTPGLRDPSASTRASPRASPRAITGGARRFAPEPSPHEPADGERRPSGASQSRVEPAVRAQPSGELGADTDGAAVGVPSREGGAARRREARQLALRKEYWAREFPEVVASLSKAVFVVDDVGDVAVCDGVRDMQWLYALHVAYKALGSQNVVFAVPDAERRALDALLLDTDARNSLFKAMRSISFARSRARSEQEDAALSAAIAGELGAAHAAFADAFTTWALRECQRVIDEHAPRAAHKELGVAEVEALFELMRARIDLWALGHQNRPHDGGQARGAVAPWVTKCYEETLQLHAFALNHFGPAHDKTLDAVNRLANVLRLLRDPASIARAIASYEKVIAHEEALNNSVGGVVADAAATMTRGLVARGVGARDERLAGAHMQLADTLRDLGEFERAEPHYRAALKYSLEGLTPALGKEALNTQHCRVSLANCLRALRDGCATAADVDAARRARGGGAGAAADAKLAAVEVSHNRSVELLKEAERLYREAEALISRFYKALHAVSVSVKLNHACVLMEMALAADDKWDKEARALLDELLAQCDDQYGSAHECTLYVSAKVGELQVRFGRDIHTRTAGQKRMKLALAGFDALRLPADHPRVDEVRRMKARGVQGTVGTPAALPRVYNGDRDGGAAAPAAVARGKA
ncbi:hypothetical protein KFE25_006820 [Diacronema lutheri]|uniref:Uncharacterized protein n=1 Tax=Diacronema lutheri TaxID=2081491 RepID=A0A8J6CHH7_DIALT|nr:hypothetical protein KFE25_006820 [Diacronema lutheri]